MTVLIDVDSFVVVHVPQSQLDALGLSLEDEQDCVLLETLLRALDDNAAGGNVQIASDIPWYFTSEEVYSVEGLVFSFNQVVDDRSYSFVIGADGSVVSEADSSLGISLNHASYAVLSSSETTAITQAATGFAALAEFFQDLDFSPLWVTLKTTLTAIVIIFILGILAAWWSLRLSDRWQNVFDAIFTIPWCFPLPFAVFCFCLPWVATAPLDNGLMRLVFRLYLVGLQPS